MVKVSAIIAKENVASVRPEVAARVAATDCCVLLTGETGTGKDYLARWLHASSRRAARSFVPVNCGAIPEGLIDSHLFGHRRGAFTDALRENHGLVREAEGGTLFLDEIGEMGLTAQTRLLRLLDEQEIQPVGGPSPVRVDVRIIAATRCDLWQAVRERRFRADLLYRLDVIHFHLQPLRQRRREIPALVEQLNAEVADQIGRLPFDLDHRAMRLLVGHPWPGNVRQLRSVFERMHVLCPQVRITAEDVVEYGGLQRPVVGGGAGRLRRRRLEAVRDAVQQCGGNVTRAARVLGVHRSTVHRWLARACATA